MIPKLNYILPTLAGVSLAVSAFGQTSVFNDTFNTDAASFNDYGYIASGNFGTGAELNVSGGAMNVVYGASSGGLVNVVRHFPTQSLNEGWSIQADFTFSTAPAGIGNAQRGFRFSLGYVASGDQLTQNNQSQRSPIMGGGFTGYASALTAGVGNTSSIAFIESTGNPIHKEGLASNGNDGGSLVWLEDSTSALIDQNFSNIDGQFMVTRTATGYDITVNIGGVLLSTSHVGNEIEFNTLGFGMNGGQPENGGFVFDNMSVTVIPEPSVYAGLFGILAIGLALYRRRKQ